MEVGRKEHVILQYKVLTGSWYLVAYLSSSWRALSPLFVLQATTAAVASLVPRPSLAPVVDRLQYAKTEPEGLVNLTSESKRKIA